MLNCSFVKNEFDGGALAKSMNSCVRGLPQNLHLIMKALQSLEII